LFPRLLFLSCPVYVLSFYPGQKVPVMPFMPAGQVGPTVRPFPI
jgi:hypothetical protein